MKKRIIISGAGIAGLTAAKLLHEQGHEITVIDKADQFTNAGFLLSLKSFGVSIMDQLALGAALRNRAVPAEFMDFMEADGQLIRHVSYDKMRSGADRSITLTRGDLHQVLHDAVKDRVGVRLGTTLEAIQQDAEKVTATLSGGASLEADLLIVAEGLRSVTRRMYFAESAVEDFNVVYIGGRLKANHRYNVGHFKTFISVGTMLSVYPISRDELAIQGYVHDTDERRDVLDRAKQLMRDTAGAYPADTQGAILDFLNRGSLFADRMGMVHAPSLINGRLMLLGDAGYCPTALSGMGASLSIYGAKAIAHFLGQAPDSLQAALTNYDALMRPVAAKFQHNARNNAQSFLPKDAASLDAFASAFRSASERDAYKRLTDQLLLTNDQLKFVVG